MLDEPRAHDTANSEDTSRSRARKKKRHPEVPAQRGGYISLEHALHGYPPWYQVPIQLSLLPIVHGFA